jgi:hypothetical protein
MARDADLSPFHAGNSRGEIDWPIHGWRLAARGGKDVQRIDGDVARRIVRRNARR